MMKQITWTKDWVVPYSLTHSLEHSHSLSLCISFVQCPWANRWTVVAIVSRTFNFCFRFFISFVFSFSLDRKLTLLGQRHLSASTMNHHVFYLWQKLTLCWCIFRYQLMPWEGHVFDVERDFHPKMDPNKKNFREEVRCFGDDQLTNQSCNCQSIVFCYVRE